MGCFCYFLMNTVLLTCTTLENRRYHNNHQLLPLVLMKMNIMNLLIMSKCIMSGVLRFFFHVCSRTSRRMETIFSCTSVSDGCADTVDLSAHHQVQQRSVQPLPGRLQSPMANVHLPGKDLGSRVSLPDRGVTSHVPAVSPFVAC